HAGAHAAALRVTLQGFGLGRLRLRAAALPDELLDRRHGVVLRWETTKGRRRAPREGRSEIYAIARASPTIRPPKTPRQGPSRGFSTVSSRLYRYPGIYRLTAHDDHRAEVAKQADQIAALAFRPRSL